jgi:hypothetical protein
MPPDTTRPRGVTPDDDDRIMAGVELVARTGARQFEVGYLHEDVPAHEADWYAHAQYRGTRIMVEHHSHPADAVEALAVRLLTGAKCACGKLVALTPGGALAFRHPHMSDGSVFTIEQAQQAGQCLWRREGQHWVSGCGLRSARRRDT